MHRIFGKKENVEYMDREGVYLIPVYGTKIGIVQIPKGLFLLGGGIENRETHQECIKRECIEEIGYTVSIGKKICSAETYCIHSKIGYFHPIQTYYYGHLLTKIQEPIEKDRKLIWREYKDIKGKLYAEMQNWAVETYIEGIK